MTDETPQPSLGESMADDAELVVRRGAVVLSHSAGRWIGSVFGTMPSGPLRHSPTDAGRFVVGALVIALAASSADGLSGPGQWLLELVAPISTTLDGVFTLLAWAGLVLPPLIIVIAALVSRRWRLLLAVLATVVGTAAAVWALLAAVEPVSGATLTSAGIPWPGGDPEYPALQLALASAVVFGAGPYLKRPSHLLANGALIVSAICQLCLLVQIPSALVGGLVLGWTVAALVHLIVGSPAGIPRAADVARALAGTALGDVRVGEGEETSIGVRRFSIEAEDGRELTATVLGSEALQKGTLVSVLRRIWLKDSGPNPSISRRATAEHRALLLLLAERGGAPVPSLVVAASGGELGAPVLVTTRTGGRALDELEASEVTPALLDGTWTALDALHRTGVAHGRIGSDSLRVFPPDGHVVFTDLDNASFVEEERQKSLDRAALLLVMANLADDAQAIASLRRCAGDDALDAVLPLMQPAAFSSRMLRALRDGRKSVARLRAAIAVETGDDSPELVELRRVAPSTLFMTAGALLGVYLIVGELRSIGGFRTILANADPWWVGVVAVLSQTPQLAQAIGMVGSVMQPIPLGPATAVQFANQFMGLIGGTLATTTLVIRYFQRMGLDVAVAVSSGLINTFAGMVTQVILVGIGLFATWNDWNLPTRSGSDGEGVPVLVFVILVVGVLAGIVMTLPRFRHKITAFLGPHVAAARANLHQVRTHPRKGVQIFGGAAASQILFALTLMASLQAYGESLPLLQIIVVNSFASLIGGIAPIPGGMGVVEAGMIMGLVAAGIPQEQATAATFTHRLFTAYLPPIWGWFFLRWLRRHDYV